jgi:hypothetical protein
MSEAAVSCLLHTLHPFCLHLTSRSVLSKSGEFIAPITRGAAKSFHFSVNIAQRGKFSVVKRVEESSAENFLSIGLFFACK